VQTVGSLTGLSSLCVVSGVFELRIDVGAEYPIHPPVIRFVTKIFHPNVHFDVSPAESLFSPFFLPYTRKWICRTNAQAIELRR
jgi:hypothetical protein